MLSYHWDVRQQTRNNKTHWFSCQKGTHPFLESFAALEWEPNYGFQMTTPPQLPKKEKKNKNLHYYLEKGAEWTRNPDCQASHESGTAHQTVTQADCPKAIKWQLFFHTTPLDATLHLCCFQDLWWHAAGSHLLASYSSVQELRAVSRRAGTVAQCILFFCRHYTQLWW